MLLHLATSLEVKLVVHWAMNLVAKVRLSLVLNTPPAPACQLRTQPMHRLHVSQGDRISCTGAVGGAMQVERSSQLSRPFAQRQIFLFTVLLQMWSGVDAVMQSVSKTQVPLGDFSAGKTAQITVSLTWHHGSQLDMASCQRGTCPFFFVAGSRDSDLKHETATR